MKVSGAKQVHYESGPNMTPLVDVVMVILIFLMLAGSFGMSEHFLQSKTPIHAKGGGGVAPEPGWVPPTLVEINVNSSGDALMPNGEKVRDPEIFRQRMETRLAEFKGAGKKVSELEVILYPDTRTTWEALAPLYDAALRADFEKVAFGMTGGGR